MGDEAREFQIRITGDASSLVAATKQSNEALNQTGTAGKESAKGLEETAKSAASATVKHKDLRAAVLGLRLEFPELARVAHMALHPITLVVAAAAAAWSLYTTRVAQAIQTMAGVELPNISPQKVGQVTSLAEAWNSYADAVGRAGQAYNSIEAAADRAIKRLQAQAQQQKQLLTAEKAAKLAELEELRSFMTPADYERGRLSIEDRYAAADSKATRRTKEDKIYLQLDEARDLRLEAANKLKASAAIRIGTAEQDAQTESDLKARADEAQKSIAERRQRIGDIRAVGAGEHGDWTPKGIWAGFEMQRRYGLLARSPAGMEQAVEMERAGMAVEQVNIDRYNAFLRNRAARDEARKRKTRLAGEAGADFGRAGVVEAESGAEMEAAAGEFGINRRVAGMESITRARQALGQANDRLKQFADEVTSQVQAQHGITSQQIDKMAVLTELVFGLEKKVRDIEGRAPRTY